MEWLLLIHQLPPKPIYLRAKIGNRLARVGGVALKNSVYLLPDRDDCLEDFQWIAEEAVSGGGAAFVWRAELVSGTSDEALRARFRSEVGERYEALKKEISTSLGKARGHGERAGAAPRDQDAASGVLLSLKKKLHELERIDFFDALARKETETMLHALENRLRAGDERNGKNKAGALVRRPDLVGRTWVTRQNPKVDRLASAWLIRRFIDPGARFRFIEPGTKPGEDEIGFDLVGGEFTHEGDRCTFETLLLRTGVSAPGLDQVGEIVHDIDLKDGKFGRPDAAGVQQLILGLCQAHARDEERLEQGLALFDNLYASFPRTTVPAPARKRPRARTRRPK
jgi:hypothetical protein